MQKVLIPFPTEWDRRHLEGCPRWAERFDVIFGEPADEDCRDDFDVPAYVERVAAELAGKIAGVFSSSDYPGAAAAAAIAERLALPGPSTAAVLAAAHKLRCREIGRAAVPEATPPFARVDPDRPESPFYPCFVKPAKGAFSRLTGRVENGDELRAFLARPAVESFRSSYLRIFDEILREWSDIRVSGGDFVAEGLIDGRLVTLEGFVVDGRMTTLGITDSITDPSTGSFLRFDYPSSLPDDVQARVRDVAERLVVAIGLERTMFNVELFVRPDNGKISVVEVNPRMCGQFADLYEKVDGRNGYEIALALAVGDVPVLPRGEGRYAAASSFPMRVFEPVRVARCPDEARVRDAESKRPGTMVWIECAPGQVLLDDDAVEDGRSVRYAVVNVGGADLDDVVRAKETVEHALAFRVEGIE